MRLVYFVVEGLFDDDTVVVYHLHCFDEVSKALHSIDI